MATLRQLPHGLPILHSLLVQSILFCSMLSYGLDHAHVTAVDSDVADKLQRGRLSGGIRSEFTDGQIQNGEAYMDGLRILLQNSSPLMSRFSAENIKQQYYS